jgi:hypothetical protein
MWLLIVIAVEAITEIIVDSKIMFPIRDWFSRPAPESEPCKHPIEASDNPSSGFGSDCCKKSWFNRAGWWLRHFAGELVNCGHCTSVWVAIPVAYFTGHNDVLMLIVKWMVIHRSSNLIHELFKKWFRCAPFSFVFTHINNKEE